MNKLLKKALFYEYLTIFWNVLEGIVCIIIGFLSGSVALLAYGLESGIEVFASCMVVWDLQGKEKKREKYFSFLRNVFCFIFFFYKTSFSQKGRPSICTLYYITVECYM